MAARSPTGRPHGVRLVQRFTPGTELTYNFTNALTQETIVAGRELSYALAMTGTARQITVDVDPRSGMALVGQLARSRWDRCEGADQAPVMSREQVWNSVWRVGPGGESVRRTPAGGGGPDGGMQRMAGQIGESPQACAPFPARALRIGDQWQGKVLVPMPGMRLPAAAVSTLLDVRGIDGRDCAVIRTDIASESVQAHTDWLPSGWLPDMTVTGATLAQLDIDRGLWVRTEWHLQARLEAQDSEGSITVRSLSQLASGRRMSNAEASAWRERIRAFDGIVSNLYEPGGVTQAIARIGELKKKETDDDWLAGLGLTLALIDPAHRAPAQTGLDTQGEARKSTPQRVRLEKADLALLAERWQEAAAGYIEVADTYPEDELAPQALAVAASICEKRLRDASRAATLRERLTAWRERRLATETNAATRTLELFRLASAYESKGARDKAAAAYKDFLSYRGDGLPECAHVLAQYRLARLDEKRGRREQALASYQAIVDLQAEDDYTGRVKEKARQRISALGGRTEWK